VFASPFVSEAGLNPSGTNVKNADFEPGHKVIGDVAVINLALMFAVRKIAGHPECRVG